MYLALSGEELGPCRRADGLALLAETGHDADARAKLAAHLEAANGLFPPVAADEFYLSKIGVTPSYRGRGFGRTLTGRFLDEGAGLGFSRFRLDVSADNAPAVHVYESLGFRVDVETERAGMRYFSMVRG